MNCSFEDYLSPQAERSRKISTPCYDPAGEFIREDQKRDARRKLPTEDYIPYDWDADQKWWEAKDKYVRSISRGGGTTDFEK